ncbi:hypothetical protein D3C85_1695330 [compost metagenome]
MDGAAAVYPAPAFAVNPNVGKAKHVVNIDDVNNRTSPATILDTAAIYGLDDKHNRQVLEQVASQVEERRECLAAAHNLGSAVGSG